MPNTQSSKRPQLVPERDAASYLHMAVPTLRKWRVFGDGPPFYKLGRNIRYDIADLDAWIAARRYTSTSAVQNGVDKRLHHGHPRAFGPGSGND